MRRALLRIVTVSLIAALVLQGCATPPAREPAKPSFSHSLAKLPAPEQWASLVLSGKKIGFSRMSVKSGNDGFVIESEASLRFRLLGIDKQFTTRTEEWVRPDLTLVAIKSEQKVDDNLLMQQGRVQDNFLQIDINSGDQTTTARIPLEGQVVPVGAVGLYPVVHGLEVGRRYAYRIYDSETRALVDVTQEVLAFERKGTPEEPAFRVRTTLHGQTAESWITPDGRVLMEISMGGALSAALEDEQRARMALSEAALNKEEVLLHFSLIRTRPIEEAREVTAMRVRLKGVREGLDLEAPGIQSCDVREEEAVCIVGVDDAPKAADRTRYLASTFVVPSLAPAIRTAARDATRGAGSGAQQIKALLDWIDRRIAKQPVDAFTALDVLNSGRAECQGHAWLFAAMARAEGIPTRVVNGIVYAEEYGGFLYHTWNESLVDGHWRPVDPIFNQFPADATHIRLVIGESEAELLPLSALVGRLEVDVLDVAR